MSGCWVDDIPGLDDVHLLVRRVGNVDYRREEARMLKAGAVDEPALLAETILCGWRGMSTGGQALAYSPPVARALLARPEMALLAEAVRWAAGLVTRQHAAGQAADCDALAQCMRWHLRWAGELAWLEAEMEADPAFTPKAMLERPDLPAHLRFAWGAFTEISTDRPVGFGAGPIPRRAIAAYCDDAGLRDPDEREDFVALIRAMDGEVLAHLADGREARNRR